MINFNEAPFLGTEFEYIKDAIDSKHISGDGKYTKLCNNIIEAYTGTQKCLLTLSATSALEICALLLDIQPGDEVICPSYTFVTTASSFALRGAKLVFVDVCLDTGNIDESKIEAAITNKTKVIIVVHYAGVSCDMDKIMAIAKAHNIAVVEDAAQAVGSSYKNKPCGTVADLGCYSFHETKNISSGEGGALLVNRKDLTEKAEIIREKGTNRSRFFRGQVDKYTWVELGSSYLPSEMIAAYLYPQLKEMDTINNRRLELWNNYYQAFEPLERFNIALPFIPNYCTHNAHMFYLRFKDIEIRTRYIQYMKKTGIACVFHYIPLHSSPAGQKYGRVVGSMENTNLISDTLVRLPLYYALNNQSQEYIILKTMEFFDEAL